MRLVWLIHSHINAVSMSLFWCHGFSQGEKESLTANNLLFRVLTRRTANGCINICRRMQSSPSMEYIVKLGNLMMRLCGP